MILLSHFKLLLFRDKGDEIISGRSWHEREDIYRKNWEASTMEERNTLLNLALSDMFNPRNPATIKHLIQRGLVTLDPPYRLLDAGFKDYILADGDIQALRSWRKAGKGSLWSAIWPTLLVIIGLLMFFVISAGHNTVKTAFALLASIIAALPVLMSVFAMVRSNSGSGGGG